MINPENTKMELNVRAIRTFLTGFENLYGKKELSKFIEETGMPLPYFEDENNWISYNYYCKVLDALVDYTGGIEIPYKFGLNASTSTSWGIVKTIVSSFISCNFTYKSLISISPRWVKCGRYQILSLKNNKAIIEYKLREEFKQTKNNCLVGIQSQLIAVPTLFNLPPAKIKELQCAAEGAESCIYELEWHNPPYKKTGLYFLIVGTIVSFSLVLLHQLKLISISFIIYLLFIITPVFIYSIWKMLNQRKILKHNLENTEEQNKILTNYLIEIEKLNEILQKKVEDKTNELLNSNKELKKKLLELQENEEQLIQSQKIATIGQIAVEMAGKLKIVVESVKKKLLTLIDKTPESDEIHQSLTDALRAAGRCDNIIDDLLTFSMKENNEIIKETDISIIIDECVTKANEAISNPYIEIIARSSEKLPKVIADPKQLEQVFMIFLMNANDAIYTTAKENIKPAGKILIKSSVKNNIIIIGISDTGCGIPREIVNKIFDPFFSTKNTSTRKGMGLTLAFNIIKKYGGNIQVESVPDKGTTFSIYIPIEKN